MRDLLENAKRQIFEKEVERKIKRVFSEEIPLLSEWKKKYSQFVGFLHSHKLWIQALKLKIIDKRETSLYSTTEALRLLLEQELDQFNIKKIRYRTDFKTASQAYFPYLYKTGEFLNSNEFVKADISRCFYEIYSKTGIDSNIICDIDLQNKKIEIKAIGKGIINSKNSWLIRQLGNFKEYRNIVYGLTRASWIIRLQKEKTERQYFRGRLQNLDLTIIIASLLHGVVKRFRKYIVYWNIDGGIITAEGFKKMQKYLEQLGFKLKKEVVSNEVIILGLGSYKIGDYETLHFKSGVTTEIKEKEYVFEIINFEKIEKLMRRLADE